MHTQLPALPSIPASLAVTRPNVRQIAAEHHTILGIVAASGGNIHQVALDQQDRLLAFMSTLSEPDAAVFSKLYTEELDALTAGQQAETARINAQVIAEQSVAIKTAQQSSQVGIWISLIVFFAFLIFMIKLMKG